MAANEQLVTGFDGHDSLSYDPAHAAGFGLFTGSHAGIAAAPAGDHSQYMAINAGGSVLFDLRAFNSDANPITSVSVYIGSADPYNFIDVLGTDGNGALDAAHPLLTIGGANLPGDNGDWYSSLANGRLDAGHGDRQDAARYFAVDECSAGGVRSSRLSQDRALYATPVAATVFLWLDLD